jgi:transcriptional regulator with XRE-family HTH domain
LTKSVFSTKYDLFRHLLIEARKSVPLTQVELARRLGKPQSFISKYENGERRLDVAEFIDIAQAMELDPRHLLDQLLQAIQEQTKDLSGFSPGNVGNK